MKKVIIIGILLVLSIASNVSGANECASTLSNDLKLLHIPALSFYGNFYLLDIEYVSTVDFLLSMIDSFLQKSVDYNQLLIKSSNLNFLTTYKKVMVNIFHFIL